MATTVFCSRCWTADSFTGEWRQTCRACGRVTRWVTTSMLDAPKVKYELTWNDCRFLHSLRIDPQEPPVLVEG